MTKITVGLVQHDCSDNVTENLTQSIAGIEEAANKGAKLVVLQELHCSRYFCVTENHSNFDLAETIPGNTTDMLADAAIQHNVVIVSSLFEKRAPGIYHNTAVVIDTDGSIAGTYRKMHIPDDPGYFEKFYFTPGDTGFNPIQTSLGKLGVLVCWDQWFPEAARIMSMRGADILIYPTAIGIDLNDDAITQQQQRDAWITIQRSHAIANGIPVLACNRIGREPHPTDQSQDINFWGSSFIAGQQGEIIGQASSSEVETLVGDIDLRRTEEIRRMWPYFRDRRTDQYDGLNQLWMEDQI